MARSHVPLPAHSSLACTPNAVSGSVTELDTDSRRCTEMVQVLSMATPIGSKVLKV